MLISIAVYLIYINSHSGDFLFYLKKDFTFNYKTFLIFLLLPLFPAYLLGTQENL